MKQVEIYRDDCSGCSACVQICPKCAISMISDEQGFLYPTINAFACINCGMCLSVCQCKQKSYQEEYDCEALGVQNKNITARMKSQSGGLFTAIAETILFNGGICYGAALNEELQVIQMRIADSKELYMLQGSKYVQSNVGESFIQTEKDLKDGLLVLYSGTSCMIDGLKLYLNKRKIDITNLYTADLVCHGVPSPRLYEENKKRIENQNHDILCNVNFRDKNVSGWHLHIETYTFQNGKQIHENYWAELMYSHMALRECCYRCKYVDLSQKAADITMADFWGIEEIYPDYQDDNTGYSLAVIHSEKGRRLIETSNLSIREAPINQVLNKNMNKVHVKPKQRDNFWRVYKVSGYEYALRKYTIYGGKVAKLRRRILMALDKW